jgi:hypothetical protein
MAGTVDILSSVLPRPRLAMTGKERLTFTKLLKSHMKRLSVQTGEFLDFGGSGWLDPPRSGEAALAPVCPV